MCNTRKSIMKQQIDRPIDIVITYLDGEDPAWLDEKKYWQAKLEGIDPDSNGEARYRNMDNFQYILRGIDLYAPWVRKIHIVTWGHLPDWLDTDHPKIAVVSHRDFIPEDCLPTFNSNTIELYMDRIPGLAEQFIIFNDDTFLINPTKPSHFFSDGKPVLQLMHAPFMPSWSLFSNNILALNSIVGTDHLISPKMFSYKNGLFAMLSNIYLVPLLLFYKRFLGFRSSHLPLPHTKTIYQEVKGALPAHIAYTSHAKFRDWRHVLSINHWLMADYARATNRFEPHNAFKFGKLVDIKADIEIEALVDSRYKVICLADSDALDESEFGRSMARINCAFARKFPKKSCFERYEIDDKTRNTTGY